VDKWRDGAFYSDVVSSACLSAGTLRRADLLGLQLLVAEIEKFERIEEGGAGKGAGAGDRVRGSGPGG
jgi:hypothetical protein